MTNEGEVEGAVLVSCDDCPFEVAVESADGKAADVVIQHGRETGHTLTVGTPDDLAPDDTAPADTALDDAEFAE